MPCAMIWSTFAVIVAESDLPSKMNTSAPYLSLAYFCASVACPWWNTFVMSDTKNAIFFGLSVAGFGASAAAGAAGAAVGSAGAAVGAAGASVGAAGAAVGAAGAAGAAPPQADRTRLASTSRATSANRFFFMVRFSPRLLITWLTLRQGIRHSQAVLPPFARDAECSTRVNLVEASRLFPGRDATNSASQSTEALGQLRGRRFRPPHISSR